MLLIKLNRCSSGHNREITTHFPWIFLRSPKVPLTWIRAWKTYFILNNRKTGQLLKDWALSCSSTYSINIHSDKLSIITNFLSRVVSNIEGIFDFSVEYYCFEFTMIYCSFIIGEQIYRNLTCVVYHLRSQKLLQSAVVSKSSECHNYLKNKM